MKKLGIIVGRFQVSELTKGHTHLIECAKREFNDNVIIFLGETKNSERTAHDPLSYEARKVMINEEYPRVKVYLIRDIGDYQKWVRELDKRIEMLKDLEEIPRNSEIYICGSRDSVVNMYKENGGVHNIREYTDMKNLTTTISGTDSRNEIIKNYRPKWTKELREFLIWWYGENDND